MKVHLKSSDTQTLTKLLRMSSFEVTQFETYEKKKETL